VVQVILRLYGTQAEVIHSFDIGACSVLWDGACVRFNRLGRLAFTHGVNVLDLSSRRASYERRLAKYSDRGYSLILPHLDMDKLRAKGLATPYGLMVNIGNASGLCGLAVRLRHDCKIHDKACMSHGARLYVADDENKGGEGSEGGELKGGERSERGERGERGELKGYENEDHSTIYEYPPCIAFINLGNICHNDPSATRFCIAHAEYKPGTDISAVAFQATKQNWVDFIAVKGRIDKINFKVLAQVFGAQQAVELLQLIITRQTTEIDKLCESFVDMYNPRMKFPLKFIDIAGGTDLLSTFPICVTTEKEWYGEFMKVT
jgi:hypothetical protein